MLTATRPKTNTAKLKRDALRHRSRGLTVSESATLLRVSVRTVFRWLKEADDARMASGQS